MIEITENLESKNCLIENIFKNLNFYGNENFGVQNKKHTHNIQRKHRNNKEYIIQKSKLAVHERRDR